MTQSAREELAELSDRIRDAPETLTGEEYDRHQDLARVCALIPIPV